MGCFHGGRFFEAVGPRFDDLGRASGIINADVLDAWFAPAPGVIAALREHLPWLVRTSPPTACEGFVALVAETRGVSPVHILPGAGSSDLIFRCFRHWLGPGSSVLLLDPTYGEYAHVLEKVIGCRVDRFTLSRNRSYDVDLARLEQAITRRYDLVVLVNPNSPTGRHIGRARLEAMLRRVPSATRVWIDETYVEYAGAGESLERFAVTTENVFVCKSMSKVYALSGLRVAYLCGGRRPLEALRAITPPWVIGLPAQVAAVRALQDPAYYAGHYRETHRLREQLAGQLRGIGWDVVPGRANFLLAHLPAAGPDAARVVEACQTRGLFLRSAAGHNIRIAVKDAETNRRMVEIIRPSGGVTVERRGKTSDAAAMKFPWSFFTPHTTPPKLAQPVPNTDAELTRTAAQLLRAAGVEAVAALVAVVWHSRLSSTAGLARPASALVLLNPRLKEFPEEVERTLRHELAHLLAHARSRGRRIAAHGPEWKQACADLGIAGESRCHTLPLPRRQVNRPHVYRCPRCDFHLRRVRPIKARRRLACHDCCKRHAGGRFDRRFEFVKVKPKPENQPHPASSGMRCESRVQQTLNF